MAWLCGGGSFKNDVQIGTMQFLPVEFKVSGRLISLLDTNGTFLVEQVQQYQEYQQKKQIEEENKKKEQGADFVHPKVEQANKELTIKQEKLKEVNAEVERLQKEYELLQDLLISQSLDQEQLDNMMHEVEDARAVCKLEKGMKIKLK